MSRNRERVATGAVLFALVLGALAVGQAAHREAARARIDALLMERAGREWTLPPGAEDEAARYHECRALILSHDWDGAGCAWQWEDLSRLARMQWGPDGDPETGGGR